MRKALALTGQLPGYYLKCGMHWIKLTNYGRADWCIADPERATRIEDQDVAQALQSLFNNRDRGCRELDLIEVIDEFCLCEDDKQCVACTLKLEALRAETAAFQWNPACV